MIRHRNLLLLFPILLFKISRHLLGLHLPNAPGHIGFETQGVIELEHGGIGIATGDIRIAVQSYESIRAMRIASHRIIETLLPIQLTAPVAA